MQKRLAEKGGERYQCGYKNCRLIYTTLALAEKHVKLSKHDKMVVANPLDEYDTEEEELEILHPAPIITINQFMKRPPQTDELEILHPAPVITISQFMKQPFLPTDFEIETNNDDETS